MLEYIRSLFSGLAPSGFIGPDIEIGGLELRFVVPVLVFVGALVAFEGLRQLLKRGENREEAVNRRIRMLNEGKSGEDVLNLLKPAPSKPLLKSLPFVGDLPAALKAANIPVLPEMFLLACGAGFLIGAIAGSAAADPVSAAAASAAVFLILPLAVLGSKLKARKAQLVKQLPDALDLMSRGLKVGHPLNATLQSVASEMPDPIGSEFGIVVDQVAYGDELTAAIRDMADRLDEEDIRYLSVALTMQHGSGGDLAGILRTLARVIRARMSLRRKIKAISSEGRLTAYILSFIPVGIVIVMTIFSPDYYGSVMDAPMFWPVMGCIAVAVVANAAVLLKLVNFRI